MKNDSIPDPGEEYWNEVSSLIMAKTIDTPSEETVIINLEQQKKRNKNAFYRSLVSVAASLLIFFTSLIYGSYQDKPLVVDNSTSISNLKNSVMSESEESDNSIILTQEEQRTIIKGIILIGSPGHIGQYRILSDLSSVW